ncbi:MAG: sensor histidine kinase, partial [Rubrobacteraceae bacterium]
VYHRGTPGGPRKVDLLLGWIRGIREQPWRVTMAAVGGLLVAIIVAGLIGFWQMHNIERVADEAFGYVELEDEGDDIRAAILDVRHYHRNLYFSAIDSGRLTSDRIEDYEATREQLYEEIDELEEVGAYDADAPQPEDFRRWAEEYYAGFWPFVQRTEISDREAFDAASDRGLGQIQQMEQKAEVLDGLGEELTDDSLQRVDQAASTSALVLLGAIVGLLLAGAALAYAAVRVVNELRRLYAEQQQAAEKLAASSRAKTDFLADVSHELRTPLTVLHGNAQVGLALDPEEEQKQILHEMVEESRRMSRLVEDLLFLARSDSTSPSMRPETVSAASFASELAGRAEMLVREHGATLQTDLRAEGALRADPARLEQAVFILLDNAIKYGPPGGVVTLRSDVTRAVTHAGGHAGVLRITVEDRGPGIPRNDLPRIFERFYRVNKARSRKMGGAGLGLPIARTIVESHSGHITAESRPGEGTTMSLYLPLIHAEERETPESRLEKERG